MSWWRVREFNWIWPTLPDNDIIIIPAVAEAVFAVADTSPNRQQQQHCGSHHRSMEDDNHNNTGDEHELPPRNHNNNDPASSCSHVANHETTAIKTTTTKILDHHRPVTFLAVAVPEMNRPGKVAENQNKNSSNSSSDGVVVVERKTVMVVPNLVGAAGRVPKTPRR